MMLFQGRRFRLGCLKKSRYHWLVFVLLLPFDLAKAGATQAETSSFKQHHAGECVYKHLLDNDVPANLSLKLQTTLFVCKHEKRDNIGHTLSKENGREASILK